MPGTFFPENVADLWESRKLYIFHLFILENFIYTVETVNLTYHHPAEIGNEWIKVGVTGHRPSKG